MRRSGWIVAVMIASLRDVHAGDLRLADAIEAATASNPSIGIATTSIDEAGAAERIARGAYEPVVVVALTGTAAELAVAGDPRTRQADASVAIVKPTKSGGQLRVAVGGTALAEDSPMRSSTTWSPRLDAEWQQPLRGGRLSGAFEAEALSASREAAVVERLAAATLVIRDVEQAYWRLHLAQRELEIRRQTAALAQSQLERTRIEIARGARPPLAEAEFDEELVRRRDDALLAASLLSDRSLELSRLLGFPATTELRAIDPPPPAIAGGAELVDRAVAASPEMRALKLRDRALVAELAQIADSAAMRIDAVVRGSVAGSGPTAAASTRFDGWSIELGLSVRLPLGRDARHGARDVAHARLQRVRIEAHDVVEAVRAAALRELERLATAAARRSELQRSIALAELSLAAEQRRWERGDSTPFDVLRRQAVVGEIALRAERARLDQVVASVALESLTGDLLARHRVVLR